MAKTNNPQNKQTKPANGGNSARKGQRPGKPGKGKGMKPPYRKPEGDKQDRRGEEIADDAAAMSRSNPISFYDKYTQLAHDAARIPFARVVGSRYSLDFSIQGAASSSVSSFTAVDPGIMRICFSPAVGVSQDFTSPLNRSSINYYGRLRSTQKAFGDYDHQDLTIMMLAIDSCIMFHALGRKIYGVLNDMTPINRYYPRTLVGACGVQFPDTQKNIQDFRAWLNEFALQIEQYALPDNIELFKRHQWMCEGLYTDSEATRAQTYMFVPAGFWQYNNTAATGSELVYKAYIQPGETASTQYTIDQFMEFGNALINAISNENDFSQISGDLYAYYGGDVMKLPYIEESYSILPKYDKVVLSQIENATICGWWANGYQPTISQNPTVNQGAIIFTPNMQATSTHVPRSHTMNFHWDSPSEEDVIEASRLMATFSPEIDSEGGVALTMCSTEIVHCLDIFVTNPTTMGVRSRRLQQPCYKIHDGVSSFAEVVNAINDLVWLQKFDWAPQLYFFTSVKDENWLLSGSTWDVDNSTVIPDNYVDMINVACLYSLFNVESR